ncbi:MAG: hypothetical protein IJY94_02395 [Clostridia bacterium]|nr:hypothetical protein [Clostridia bacterium]
MKKRIKQIFSILTVAVILVSTLPIGTSAATAGTGKSIMVNFGFDSQMYGDYENSNYPMGIKEAMENCLTIEYMDSNGNLRDANFNGNPFSISITDVTGSDIYIYNESMYEFRYDLVVPNGGPTFGVISIPPATSSGRGVYKFDLATVFAKSSTASSLTFWGKTSLYPIYHGPGYNTNYAEIRYVTPNGIARTDRVYAPEKVIGSYSYVVQYLVQDGFIAPIPQTLDGYKINSSTVPESITIDPDTVNVYTVSYQTKLNTNYAEIRYVTPAGVGRTDRVYAPDGVYGSYTWLMQDLVNDGYIARTPEYLDGYKIDWTSLPVNIVVDPYVVNVYNVSYQEKLNTSYAIIYASTPEGTQEVARVYAPENHLGDYSYLTQYLLNDGMIPSPYNGYAINPELSPEVITVYADYVAEYTLVYSDFATDKAVTINFYDQNGNFVGSNTYYVNSKSYSFEIPNDDKYIYAPMKVNLSLSFTEESFKVYRFDFEGERLKAYEEGKKEGLTISQNDLQAQLNSKYQEGYDVGFDEGYKDGSVITGKERNEIMKNYNAITGLFDGWFDSIYKSIDIVFNGVAIGGVTLGNIFWTLVIVVVVVLIGGKLL